MCANQIAHEVDLGTDNINGGDGKLPAVAEQIIAASALEHGYTIHDRIALANEIQNNLSPSTISDSANANYVLPVDKDSVVSPPGLTQFKGFTGAINHNNFSGREGFKALNPDMPQATRADHHGFCARIEQRD